MKKIISKFKNIGRKIRNKLSRILRPIGTFLSSIWGLITRKIKQWFLPVYRFLKLKSSQFWQFIVSKWHRGWQLILRHRWYSSLTLTSAILSLMLVMGLSMIEHLSTNTLSHNAASLSRVVDRNYDKLVATQPQKIATANYKYRQTNATIQQFAAAKKRYKKTINQRLIGQLSIPSIDIKLPVFAGMSNDALLNGVGTLSKNQVMGVGNYVMMAHNVPEQFSSSLLQPLTLIQPNSKIYVTDFQTTYVYKTNYKRVVNQNKTQLLANTIDPTVTLFRCFGNAGTSKRLVVQGTLVDVKHHAKTNQNSRKAVKKINNDLHQPSLKVASNATFHPLALSLFTGLALTGNAKADGLQFTLCFTPLFIMLIVLLVVILKNRPHKTQKKLSFWHKK